MLTVGGSGGWMWALRFHPSVTAQPQREPAGGVVTTTNSTRDVNTFTNSDPITINDNAPASAYPSVISVPAIPGRVSKVTCTINGLTHDFVEDVDVLLVSPQGQKIQLIGDIGGDTIMGSSGLNNFVCRLDDAGPAIPTQPVPIPDGTYRPTDLDPDPNGDDLFPSPAPAGPYAASLGVLNNINPVGEWKLFVRDDSPRDGGTIAFGWSLTIATEETVPTTPTLTQFYPVAATTGKTIRLFGTGFVPGNTQVFFGGDRRIAATVMNVTATALDVIVPASGNTQTANINGYLTVRVAGQPDVTTEFLPPNGSNPGDPATVFPEFVLWGDTDGDGVFQTKDLTLARAFLQFQLTPSARQLLAVDVFPQNGNGSRGNGQLEATDFTFLRAVSLSQTNF